MPRPSALQTVLVLRRHREDAEERVLTTIQYEMRDAVSERERLDNEVASVGAARCAEVQCCVHGADHHRTDAIYRQLLERRAEIGSRIEKLKESLASQMNRYLVARQEREVINDLEQKRLRACRAEAAARETKQIEDLFLARFGRQ